MKAAALLPLVFFGICMGTVHCDELVSGLQLGDLATPFEVKDVTGPHKGITLCYR